jgi:glycosyltransferase involved in cell wall biosynthesis
MSRRPERFLFLLSKVLGGKTFSTQLMHALEGIPGLDPRFVFLEEDDYGRHIDKIPGANRLSRLFIAPEILRWKLRTGPPPECDAVFVQSFELLPACRDLDPRLPIALAHDSTNLVSYRLIRDQSPSWMSSLACWAKSRITTPVYRGAIARVRAFLPRTHWCAQSLVEDFDVDPARIRVAPAGLDLETWRPAPPESGALRRGIPVLLFVGDDFGRKGGEFLLDVFTRFIHPRARLKIISRNPALRKRRWPPGVIHLSGYDSTRRMALLEEFRNAALFTFPTRKEHMGQCLAEAAAAGLPIICTDVGGTSQIVRHGENGYLMPYDASAEAWAGAILELLGNEGKRARMGVAGRALAEREFSREALRANLEWALEMAGT